MLKPWHDALFQDILSLLDLVLESTPPNMHNNPGESPYFLPSPPCSLFYCTYFDNDLRKKWISVSSKAICTKGDTVSAVVAGWVDEIVTLIVCAIRSEREKGLTR